MVSAEKLSSGDGEGVWEARDALGRSDGLGRPEGTRDALGRPEELGLPESDAVPVGMEGLAVMLALMETLWAALAVSHPLCEELRDAEGEDPPEALPQGEGLALVALVPLEEVLRLKPTEGLTPLGEALGLRTPEALTKLVSVAPLSEAAVVVVLLYVADPL